MKTIKNKKKKQKKRKKNNKDHDRDNDEKKTTDDGVHTLLKSSLIRQPLSVHCEREYKSIAEKAEVKKEGGKGRREGRGRRNRERERERKRTKEGKCNE